MPEELAAPKVPRKELGLDDSRSNTPQGFPSVGGHKGSSATAAGMLGNINTPSALLLSESLNSTTKVCVCVYTNSQRDLSL